MEAGKFDLKLSNDWPRCSHLLYKTKWRIAMTKSQLFANTYWGCTYYFLFFFLAVSSSANLLGIMSRLMVL